MKMKCDKCVEGDWIIDDEGELYKNCTVDESLLMEYVTVITVARWMDANRKASIIKCGRSSKP